MIATTAIPAPAEAASDMGPNYGSDWLRQQRRQAAETFHKIGFPAVTHEDWRLTNVAALHNVNFRRPDHGNRPTPAQLAGLSMKALGAQEMVFVNGNFAPELSNLAGKVEVLTLRNALGKHADRVQLFLGRELPPDSNGFSAMNLAGFADGSFIYLPAEQGNAGLVHLLWVTSGHDYPVVVQPRNLVLIGANTHATIVQSYASFSTSPTLCNTALEMVVGKGARVELITWQRENNHASHIANDAIDLHERATVQSLVINTGGQLVRNNLTVRLSEPFAEAILNGLTLASGDQHIDNHTLLDHLRENCPSHELYKYLLGGKAGGVFRGKILVRPNAQKTDSKQTSKTILLSDDAVMNSQPQLEIYADDVKCTHGSTTGPLDDEQLFYLQSRGVPAVEAGALLTYAFARDVLLRIWHTGMREYLEEVISGELHRLHLDQTKS
ncbi:MAG: Fe-S cluster assembly protein SufD [Phycisphaerae bacterium]